MDKLTGQYFRTKIKEINEKLEVKRINEELLQEIATVGRKDACKELKNGMRLEVITSEYKNTGEEPHLHLFPASHIDRTGKDNNYDLITRVKVTDFQPKSPEDIVAIEDNPKVSEDYQKAIYEWSKKDNKRGVNNWVAVQIVWDALNNR